MAKGFKCGVKSRKQFVRAEQGALPRSIGFYYDRSFKLPGLTVSSTRAVVSAAFVIANQYCPIPFRKARQSRSALIVLKLGPRSYFDGKGGILAMADMRSLRDRTQRQILYDPDDWWRMNSARDAAIYALPVTCHEICHTLGFGHWPNRAGGTNDLMNPWYDPYVSTPSKKEISRFYQEYPELRR